MEYVSLHNPYTTLRSAPGHIDPIILTTCIPCELIEHLAEWFDVCAYIAEPFELSSKISGRQTIDQCWILVNGTEQ